MNYPKSIVWMALVAGLIASPVQARPSLVTEEFYLPPPQAYYYRKDNGAELWQKALYQLGLYDTPPQQRGYLRSYRCHYDTALEVLSDIRKELGEKHPYQRLWAENQTKVFDACERYAQSEQEPVKPEGESLPARADSDYRYQLASWYFYERAYADALPLYEKVAAVTDAPMRPYATYMQMRSLAELGRPQEALKLQESILADASLTAVHAIARNYRFVMGYHRFKVSRYNTDRNERDMLAEAHLRWLLGILRTAPETAADIEQAQQDYRDALYQLNHYFPYYDKETNRIDWWLDAEFKAESSRKRAVQAVAKEEELVDWMQMQWTFNAFDEDWLWALHQPQNPYWQQNAVLVQHAASRWSEQQGLEWLGIAMARVHPQNEHAAQLLSQAEGYITRDWQQETNEYRAWLWELWRHSIRVALGRKDYEKAYELLTGHADFKELPGDRYGQDSYQLTIGEVLRWLRYVGENEQARKVLRYAQNLYPEAFISERILLAEDWEATLSALYTVPKRGEWHRFGVWRKMVNLLPASTIYDIAADARVPEVLRLPMAQAALTRSMLLGRDGDAKDAAALLAKLSPETQQTVFDYVEEGDNEAYINLMLRYPRVNPLPFSGNRNAWSREVAPLAIDPLNPNDNNWWCRVRPDELTDELWQAAHIQPQVSHRNGGWLFLQSAEWQDDYAKERAHHDAYQRKLLAQHPYHTQVDNAELQRLAEIPSGPQYLSEAVIKREKYKAWWPLRSTESKNASAADLHYAVRTTRYGCRRDGKHGEYSRNAYAILHRFYGESVWAKATPYWFDYGEELTE